MRLSNVLRALTSTLMAAALVLSGVPTAALAAQSEDIAGVYQIDQDTTWDARKNVTDYLTIRIAEGATLTVPYGITVPQDKKFAVEGPGTLLVGDALATAAIGSEWQGYAGIGGDPSDPHPGHITIDQDAHVVAKGAPYAAGIGGGENGTFLSGDFREGARVEAYGGVDAAGIGDGKNDPALGKTGGLDFYVCQVVAHGGCTWSAGQVTSHNAPGIGTGNYEAASGGAYYRVNIYKGAVIEAFGAPVPEEYDTPAAAAIGGGEGNGRGVVTINCGEVTAHGLIGDALGCEDTGAVHVYQDGKDIDFVKAVGYRGTVNLHSEFVASNYQGFVGYSLLPAGTREGNDPLLKTSLLEYPFFLVTFDSAEGTPVASQKIRDDAHATRPTDPTREGYTFQGWYLKGGSDTEPFDFDKTEVTSDITLVAHWKADARWSLSAYSTNKDCTASVADVSVSPVKDVYDDGDEITLTAPETQGFKFLGWHKVLSVEEGRVSAYDPETLSTDPVYTFAISQNTSVAAVYEPTAATATVKIFARTDDTYQAFCDNKTYAVFGDREIDVPLGERMDLEVSDTSRFLSWTNESGKLLGTGAKVSLYVLSFTTVHLNTSSKKAGESTVQFVSDCRQVLSVGTFVAGDEITFPTAPSKSRCVFEKWVFADEPTVEATPEALAARLGKKKLITIKPTYKLNGKTWELLVREELDGKAYGTMSVRDASDGEEVTVTDAASGDLANATFLYWKDAKTNAVLSYKKNLVTAFFEDRGVVACYASDASQLAQTVQPKPTIVLDGLYPVSDGTVNKVKGTVTRSIPEGYKLLEQGFYYARGGAYNDENFYPTTPGVERYLTTFNQLDGCLALNVRVDATNVPVTIRGYMVLKDEATGELQYYYTNVGSATYDAL